MTDHDLNFLRLLLANAVAHWKLVFGIAAARPRVSYLDGFTFGAHTATESELSLEPHEESAAFSALEHTATFLCVNQTHAVLEMLGNHKREPEFDSAFHIACLLRNSFAHNPFSPTWQFGTQS